MCELAYRCATMSDVVRVLVVDDHALVRSGFALMLEAAGDVTVVAQASDGQQALDALAAVGADVVLMDVQMPGMDGIEATRRIVAAGDARVIILTTFDRDDYLFDSLAAGASGFLLKNADPNDLLEAVRSVHAGNALLAPEVTLRVIGRLAGNEPVRNRLGDQDTERTLASLTERERDVLAQMAQGRSNHEIAEELFLGASTVKTHVSHILAKTASRDRVQAVVFAHRAGLADTTD